MKFKLTLEVDVDLNGTDPEVIRNMILDIPRRADAEGLITGDTEAEVDDFHEKCEIIEETKP